MDSKQIARDTAKALTNYLTYQAVKLIAHQLMETNPGESIWLRTYSAGKLEDGEVYIQGLMLERKDLVLRILTVREHLAETVLDFLPEMVKAGIHQSNIAHRRQLLERLTQAQPSSSESSTSETPSDVDDPKIPEE
ncbi:chaperonin family protein RbcX [Lusitaniella coriacea LEGE 07157]|uniref:RuBisCO chaperone RbcX n=1 Tax=Lusitaniella coriacea LEGE 07157 TaxID=945747 RepID=A0A8J7AXB1_9CYAN|nr:chaperonin family protein RbcX [Lusitaniella coriacea]MBE9114359.1 chaperonin family protein RbcX [Lusitaniella coriacea LEGE 07157]